VNPTDTTDVPETDPPGADSTGVDPEDTRAAAEHRGVLKRLYHGETNANIVGRWKLWFALSAAVILLGVAALVNNGLNLGIDFTGGTVWEVPAGKAEVTDIQDAMAELGYDDVQVQEVTQNTGSGNKRFVRVEAEATAEPAKASKDALSSVDKDLRGLRDDVPPDARGAIDGVREQLLGVDGPFQKAVPAPIDALRAEIESLPGTVKSTKGTKAKVTASRQAATRMRASVDELSRLEASQRTRLGQSVSKELARVTGSPVSQVAVDTVGPSWGRQISEKARNALIVFLLAITLYITLRFEFRMAMATLAALLHDLIIVIGLYAVFGFPVTPATVIALLTILGFSIYDGIVVFDRVDENTSLVGKKSRLTYSEMANLSLNQVLMRSLNTSITALLPILSVLVIGSFVLGATTLEEFGLALFLGLLSGAYSSIFIATPLLAILKEREPKYREVRARITAATAPLATAGVGAEGGSAKAGSARADNPAAPGAAPRPRKQGKKR
jgi:preprotein translocase SecF subunit